MDCMLEHLNYSDIAAVTTTTIMVHMMSPSYRVGQGVFVQGTGNHTPTK